MTELEKELVSLPGKRDTSGSRISQRQGQGKTMSALEKELVSLPGKRDTSGSRASQGQGKTMSALEKELISLPGKGEGIQRRAKMRTLPKNQRIAVPAISTGTSQAKQPWQPLLPSNLEEMRQWTPPNVQVTASATAPVKDRYAIYSELAPLDREWKQLQSRLVDPEVNYGGDVSALREDRAREKTLETQIAQLQGDLQMAQNVARWQDYQALCQAPDFGEKSLYAPEGVTPKYQSQWMGTMLDTGVNDLLFDYVNGNEDAQKMQDSLDAAKGQIHTNWKDQAPETVELFNYIYRTQGREAAYEFMDLAAGKEFTKRQAAAMGVAQGMGLTSALGAITGVAGKLTGTEEAARESYGQMLQDAATAGQQHPVAYGLGNVGGSLALMYGAGNALKGIGGAVGALNTGNPLATAGSVGNVAGKAVKMTPVIQGMVDSALTFAATDAVHNAGSIANGYLSGEDYLKSIGVSAARGAAGGAAGTFVGGALGEALRENGLMTPFMEFVRQTTAGFSAAGANIGTGYLLSEDKPGKEQVMTDLATAFLFSVIQGGISTYKTTQATKAQMETQVEDIIEGYSELGKMHFASEAERAAAAEQIIDMTRQLRAKVNGSYIPGQQQMVNDLNAALNGIEAYLGQFVAGTSAGTGTLATSTGAMNALMPFAGGTQKTASTEGAAYTIQRDAAGNVYVQIDADILKGKPRDQWGKTVQDTLKSIFGNGLKLARGTIFTNRKGRGEYTNGSYTKMLERTDPEMYQDKMRMAAGSEGILKSASDVAYEDASHERTDDIVGFNRGKIVVSVKGAGYAGDVLTAIYSDGKETFFDINNLTRKIIEAAAPERYTVQDGFTQTDATAIDSHSLTRDGQGVKGQELPTAEASFDTPVSPALTQDQRTKLMSRMFSGATDKQLGLAIQKLSPEATQAVIAEGLQTGSGTDSFYQAKRLQQKLETGETITPSELGRLYRANEDTRVGPNSQRARQEIAAREQLSGQQSPEAESEALDRVRRKIKGLTGKEKVIGFGELPTEYHQGFREGLAKATPEVRATLEKMYKGADYALVDGRKSYYLSGPAKNIIYIGKSATPSTFAHELFHMLDRGHKISQTLSASLTQDFVALQVVSDGDIKQYLLSTYPAIFERSSRGKAVMKEQYRGISDILNGLSDGKDFYGFGHTKEYWAKAGTLEAEAWAQFGRIQFENDPKVLELLNDLFPNFWRSAIIALEGLV